MKPTFHPIDSFPLKDNIACEDVTAWSQNELQEYLESLSKMDLPTGTEYVRIRSSTEQAKGKMFDGNLVGKCRLGRWEGVLHKGKAYGIFC